MIHLRANSRFYLLSVFVLFQLPIAELTAGVIVLTNQSQRNVEFVVRPDNGGPTRNTLLPGEVKALPGVDGMDLSYDSNQTARQYHLDPGAIYSFVDEASELELKRFGLTRDERRPKDVGRGRGQQGNHQTKPKSSRSGSGVLTVKLLVDEDEPATQRGAERKLRDLIEHASDVLLQHCGLGLRVVAVATWNSDPTIREFETLRTEFRSRVDPRPADVAIGFTRQYKIGLDDIAQISCPRAPLGAHILIPDIAGKSPEIMRLELCVHQIGHYLGAVHTTESDSVMRLQLSRRPQSQRRLGVKFDAMNALVTATVAHEMQTLGIQRLEQLSDFSADVLRGAYDTMLQVLPSDDVVEAYQQTLAPESPRSPAQPATSNATKVDHPHSPIREIDSIDVSEVIIPNFHGSGAVLGAVSSPNDSLVWFGVSSLGVDHAAAHLFALDISSGKVVDWGDTRTQLLKLGLAGQHESHGMLLSAIEHDREGNLYFASVGEANITFDAEALPKNGSHLWQVHRSNREWKVLLDVPEALTAVAVAGDFLYAIGSPSDVLYQYELLTGAVRKVNLGTTHHPLSRCVAIGPNGTIHVSRWGGDGKDAENHQLFVEHFSEELTQYSETPLQEFQFDNSRRPHKDFLAISRHRGLVNAFITSNGMIYMLRTSDDSRHTMKRIGQIAVGPKSRVIGAAVDREAGVIEYVSQQESEQTTSLHWHVYDPARGSTHSVDCPTTYPLHNAFFAARRDTSAFIAFGGYERGPLTVPPTLVDALRQRGGTEDQIVQFVENTKRAHQPLLFLLRPQRRAAPSARVPAAR